MAPPLSAFFITMFLSVESSEMHLRSSLVMLGVRQWFIPVFNKPSSLVAMTCSRLGGPLGGSQVEVVEF